MQNKLTRQAIDAALKKKWKQAIAANKKIYDNNSKDIDALNRLGFAYIQTGNLSLAEKYLKKASKIDKYNTITIKNLKRIKVLQASDCKDRKKKKDKSLDSETFIEEPGSTKTVSLANLAPAKTLSTLNIGDNVTLHAKSKSVEVRTKDKIYIGALPDDVGFKLRTFIKAGCQYHVCLKKVDKASVVVFIREKKRSKKLHHQPSFSTN